MSAIDTQPGGALPVMDYGVDCLQSVSLSFLYRDNTLLDMKLGRERREGLGRDEMVAREKRNIFSSRPSLFSFNRHFFANALARDWLLDWPQEKRRTESSLDYKGRFRQKAVPFSGWRCIKGLGFNEVKYRKG